MENKSKVLFVMFGIISLLFTISPMITEGVEVSPKITDREIVESLVSIRGDIKRIDQRFDNIEKRFDAMEKRFDTMENRIDKKFDDIRNEFMGFMRWGFGVTFAGIFSLIGFVLWDRRTAITPVIKRSRELEEREDRIEKALREVAAKDSTMAEALRHVGLL